MIHNILKFAFLIDRNPRRHNTAYFINVNDTVVCNQFITLLASMSRFTAINRNKVIGTKRRKDRNIFALLLLLCHLIQTEGKCLNITSISLLIATSRKLVHSGTCLRQELTKDRKC